MEFYSVSVSFLPSNFSRHNFRFIRIITLSRISKKYRLLFWSFFIISGLYPIYFAFGSVYISTLLVNRFGKVREAILIFLSVVFFIPVYHIAFPNKSPLYIVNNPDKYRKFGLLIWEDGKEHKLPQDFADMLGWKELAGKVDSLFSKISNPKNTLILCDNYGQAGTINYYSNFGVRAVAFSADYHNWFDFDTQYYNLIRIKNTSESENEMKETSPYFETSFKVDSITNIFARGYGTTIFCFINAKVDINERIEREVEDGKNFS